MIHKKHISSWLEVWKEVDYFLVYPFYIMLMYRSSDLKMNSWVKVKFTYTTMTCKVWQGLAEQTPDKRMQISYLSIRSQGRLPALCILFSLL